VTGDAAAFTATLEVLLLAPGPLPFSPFPGDVAAVSALVDGTPVDLRLSGPAGRPALELRGLGLHRLQLSFLAPVSRFGEADQPGPFRVTRTGGPTNTGRKAGVNIGGFVAISLARGYRAAQ
jgi:hypothetical protein